MIRTALLLAAVALTAGAWSGEDGESAGFAFPGR